MLDKVVLPSKTEIRYEYDNANPTLPARRSRNVPLFPGLFMFLIQHPAEKVADSPPDLPGVGRHGLEAKNDRSNDHARKYRLIHAQTLI